MKASDLFVKCLENEGVQYIFGIPGEETEDILFSLENSKIKFIPTRHEQGGAFMADVWGRVSGKAGVCLSTLGPGATNLVTGVADANLDKSPLVAISAQAGLARISKESHQYLNLVELFKPITKWNGTIASPDVIPEVVRKAFKIAESEKPGATHIEFPEDVAGMNTKAKPIATTRVRRPDPDSQAILEAVDLLKKAKHPLIIAGNGAVRKLASQELTAFIQKFNIPIVHTLMGQGAFLDRHSQSLFTLGFGFRDIVMDAVDLADVIITVGYDIAEYAPDKWNSKKTKKIIHIDFTSAEVYAHYQPVVEIVADVPATLKELNRKLSEEASAFEDSWYVPIRRQIAKDIASYAPRGKSFTVPGVLHVLGELMRGDDLLISDVGSHKIWIGRNYSATGPNGCIISNGLASMGIALPGAIAAALYEPQRRIVAVMGDGGFLMNSQELETAKRLKLGFVVIVFNDNDYGLISWKQQMSRGRSTGTKLTNPDFKLYAQSFGIKAYRPANVNQLRSQLKYSLDHHELCVYEIPISNFVNGQLIHKLKNRERGQK